MSSGLSQLILVTSGPMKIGLVWRFSSVLLVLLLFPELGGKIAYYACLCVQSKRREVFAALGGAEQKRDQLVEGA
jgi:hypothetical protein